MHSRRPILPFSRRFSRSSFLPLLAFATLVVPAGLVACGGETLGSNGGTVDQLQTTAEGTTVSNTLQVNGQTCVEVELTPTATTCQRDSDCTFGPTGQVCDSACLCGLTPMNNAASSALFTQLEAALPPSDAPVCPCVAAGYAACVAGQCTACGLGDSPDACNQDAGAGPDPAPDADAGADGGGDGGACVYVDPTSYPTSCTQPSDCVLLPAGEICAGDCSSCPTTPANASAKAQYAAAVSQLDLAPVLAGEACGCAATGVPTCVGGQCVVDSYAPPPLQDP